MTNSSKLRHGGFNIGFDERRINAHLLQLSHKSGMAAVVAPIGVKDTQFSLSGLTMLAAEIVHHHSQVVSVHSQSVRTAKIGILFCLHIGKAGQLFHRSDGCLLVFAQVLHVFLAALHSIDIVATDGIQVFGCYVRIKEQ